MSEELVDVLTETGEKSGLIRKRDEVHQSGEWHGSTHVWLIHGSRVLLQKRAAHKESYPGLYDVSAAGHVSAGDSSLETAVRETEEELGVQAHGEDFQYVGKQKLCMQHEDTGFISNEFNDFYLLRNISPDFPFRIDPEETESLCWKEISELISDLEKEDPRYCISLEEARQIFRVVNSEQEKTV